MKKAKMPIKMVWFDMILSGQKKEEYRAITPYWETRLQGATHIEIRNGYGAHRPSAVLEVANIRRGEGKPEWGAEPGVVYFVIEIGARLF